MVVLMHAILTCSSNREEFYLGQTQDLKHLIKHKSDIHHPDNSICKCFAQHNSNFFESVFQIFLFYIKLHTITYENSEKDDLLLNIDPHSTVKKCNSALNLKS